MDQKLNVFGKESYDETFERESMHTYLPYGSGTFGHSDEIRILVQGQDLITDTSRSFIYLEGNITCEEDQKTFDLAHNFACFLFEDIRYELAGQKIDVCRWPGIASAIKGYASYTEDESRCLSFAGWQYADTLQVQKTVSTKKKTFSAAIPLKHIFGFAEDYRRAIINMRQELILIRSRTDLDCYTGDTADAKIELTRIQWKVPHLIPNDRAKLELYGRINRNSSITIPFRQWELYDLPSLKEVKSDTWAIKTSTQLEKPRWMLIAFQKPGKRNSHTAKATEFSNAQITNLKLRLNSEIYPYENWNLDFNANKYMLAYDCYKTFQEAYYGKRSVETIPLLDYEDFKSRPIFVLDCSKQKDTVTAATIDVKLDMEALSNFEKGTAAYCLIMHDALVEYNPLTNVVHKM